VAEPSALVVAAVALFWPAGALQDHTLKVVPKVKRNSIGRRYSEKDRTLGVRVALAPNAAGSDCAGKTRARLSSNRWLCLPP